MKTTSDNDSIGKLLEEQVTDRYTKQERQLLVGMLTHLHQLKNIERSFKDILGLPEGTVDDGYCLSKWYFGKAFELFNRPIVEMPRYVSDPSVKKKAIAMWRLEIGR